MNGRRWCTDGDRPLPSSRWSWCLTFHTHSFMSSFCRCYKGGAEGSPVWSFELDDWGCDGEHHANTGGDTHMKPWPWIISKEVISHCWIRELVAGSHIHFILGHPHQGLENRGWKVVDIYTELQRLYIITGFPSKCHLQCPILTQDKMKHHLASWCRHLSWDLRWLNSSWCHESTWDHFWVNNIVALLFLSCSCCVMWCITVVLMSHNKNIPP